MTYTKFKKGILKHGLLLRVTALLVCALMVLPLLPLPSIQPSVSADSHYYTNGKGVYYYMLEISSGINGGDIADYVAIKYTDTSGQKRTSIVKTDYKSYKKACDRAGYNEDYGLLCTGYSAGDYCNRCKNFYSEFKASPMPIIDRQYVLNGGRALKENSTAQFFFETCFQIDSIQSFDIYLKYIDDAKEKGIKNEWTLKNIAVYELDTIGETRMMGGFSYDNYIPYSGKIIADLVPIGTQGFDLSVDDASDAYVSLNSDSTEFKCRINQDFEDDTKRSVVSDDLYISVGFADILDAGINAYANRARERIYEDGSSESDPYLEDLVAPYDLVFENLLYINVTYEDIYGSVFSARIPYILASLKYFYTQARQWPKIYEYAQQGDMLLLKGYFPNFAKLTGFTVTYGYLNDDSVLSMKYSYWTDEEGVTHNSDGLHSTRESEQIWATSGTTISLENVTIFKDADTTNFGAYIQDSGIRFKTGNGAIYRFESSSHNGKKIEACTSTNLQNKVSLFSEMKRLDDTEDYSGNVILPEPERDSIIVEIETDTIGSERAFIYDETKINLTFRYETNDGIIVENSVDLREAAREFYSPWYNWGTLGDLDRRAYVYHDVGFYLLLQEGSKIAFRLHAPDFKQFIDMRIDCTDLAPEKSWQISRISFYRSEFNTPRFFVKSRREAFAVWYYDDGEKVNYLNDLRINSYVYIVRDYPTDEPIARINKKMLFNNEITTMNLVFTDGDVEVEEEKDDPWEQISKSLTYKQALQDLGFIKPRNQYEITVEVASNANANEIDGDSGSNNKFYFQLIFENGKSAYVQANQQLTSDGFRAGRKETFRIKTNRDYGNLKAINIIPDDMNEDADIYDKLNIKKISVIKLDDGGFNRNWIFENVGWINIDFHDSGESSTTKGQKLRSEAEMAQVKNRTGESYAVKFLLAINTLAYPSDQGQFDGSVFATIEYLDSKGVTQTKNIDVVAAINEYNGDMSASSAADDVEHSGETIDFKKHFRANHTDRLYFVLDDVEKIDRITFKFQSHITTTWKIQDIYIYKVLESGLILRNARDEIQRGDTLEYLTKSESSTSYSVNIKDYTTSTSPSTQTVKFIDHKITIDMTNGTTHVDREPKSENDKINLYIYMLPVDEANVNVMHTVEATIEYSITNEGNPSDKGTTATVKLSNMNVSKNLNLVYATGIDVAQFSSPAVLELRASGEIYADYAIIQHVRDGVTIGTYYFVFNTKYSLIAIRHIQKPADRENSKSETQTVALRMPLNMNSVIVGDDRADIAVAIRYRTTLDNSDTVYESTYMYLSDDESIKYINGGDMFKFVFHEEYVSEIVGISVLGVNMQDTALPKGYIISTATDFNGSTKVNGQYTLEGITLSKNLQTYSSYKSDMLSLRVILSGGSSSINVPDKIACELTGVDAVGKNVTYTIDDIVPYIAKGALDTDYCDFALMLNEFGGIDKLESVRLIPAEKEDGMPIAWYVNTAEVEWNVSKTYDSFGSSVKKNIVSGDSLFIDIKGNSVVINSVLYDASQIRDGSGSDYLTSEQSYQPNEGELTINLKYRDYVTFEPALPYQSFDYDFEWLSGPNIFTTALKNGVFTIRCTEQLYEENRDKEGELDCRLIITSKSDSSKKIEIRITTSYAKKGN